jgi:hypothetical protein
MVDSIPIIQSRVDDGRNVPLPFPHFPVQCYDSTDSRHQVYGQVIWETWLAYKNDKGLVWIEGDIAVGPEALDELFALVREDAVRVVAVPFRIYPASTNHHESQWATYVQSEDGQRRILRGCEKPPQHCLSFGLGCTYLPAKLFYHVRNKICAWDWPGTDWKLSLAALEYGVPVINTKESAIHLHYQWPASKK